MNSLVVMYWLITARVCKIKKIFIIFNIKYPFTNDLSTVIMIYLLELMNLVYTACNSIIDCITFNNHISTKTVSMLYLNIMLRKVFSIL